MKYFNLIVLRRIFEHSNFGTKAWYLKTARICSNTFSSHSVDYNKENLFYSRNEKFSWMLAKNQKEKAEDLIPQIVTEIEASPFFSQCVHKICKDLRHLFPAAEIKLFGSAGSNLALQNADVDIEMHFKELDKMSNEVIHSIKDKLRKSKLFTTTNAIFAHVPIIKCVHQNGVSCDISFSNHLGACDSDLIRFILRIDNRIRPLILILKYLFKRDKLIFNTHCLVVMTVFFLQVLDNPLVPPISYLQEMAKQREMLDGWNVSFTRDVSRLPRIRNQLSVIELLEKFFHFYATFEFALQVIAVFTGKFYLKPIFANAELLPEQFHLYKRRVAENESLKFSCGTYMCIQGFFNHSANISKNFIEKHVKDFQDYCRVCAAFAGESMQSNKHKFDFLIKLFYPNNIKGEKSSDLLLQGVFLMQNVPLNDVISSEDDFRNWWWKNAFNSVLEILRDVLLCEVSVKSMKVEDESGNLIEEAVISCEMQYWEHATRIRQKMGRNIDLPENVSRLEKEKIISKFLKENHLEVREGKSYQFDVVCEFKKNPTRLVLKLEPKFKNKSTDGFLLQACSYMSRQIPKWLA